MFVAALEQEWVTVLSSSLYGQLEQQELLLLLLLAASFTGRSLMKMLYSVLLDPPRPHGNYHHKPRLAQSTRRGLVSHHFHQLDPHHQQQLWEGWGGGEER